MKVLTVLLTAFLFIGGYNSQAQEDPADTTMGWYVDGKAGLVFNQVALSNWAAGGTNSIAGGATFDLNFGNKTNKWSWKNVLITGLGFSKQGEEPLNKTDDRLIFNSNIAYNFSGPWSVAGNVNFRSQFVNGYNFPNDSVVISGFMAPGYLVSGIGIRYDPVKVFSVELDPISNKTLFVLNDELSAIGAYGVDSTKHARAEFGAYLIARFKMEVIKNITIDTYLTLFSNYIDHPQRIDVNWDFIIEFKVNEIFFANFMTQLIYDDNVRFGYDSTGDGINDADESRVQLRQALGIGLGAKF